MVTVTAFAEDKCDFKNSHLISESGEKYPILSITDCFGVDIKMEGRRVPDHCLSYKAAEKLSRHYKYGFVSGSSTIEIKYHDQNLFLERYESAFASPTLSWGIYKKARDDIKDPKLVCSVPYPTCKYNFDISYGILVADIPSSNQILVHDGEPSELSLVKKHYGKLVSEVLVEGKCYKKK